MADQPKAENFSIVGVGASAGGIESFKKFTKNISENSGLAYVLIQHLDPTHKSILPEILAKHTKIPVHEITDEIAIKPNHIYVIPANRMLLITDHILKLSPRDNALPNMPIDVFFESLAEIHQAHAIGVVLSGTGQDGTKGLKAIKAHGGTTFIEDPKSATWDAMPANAKEAKVVDFVLSAEAIPEKLLSVNMDYRGKIINVNDKDTDFDKEVVKSKKFIFKRILSYIEDYSNVDFNYYKQPTLQRRIARRMAINQVETLEDYLSFLRNSNDERQALFHDLLIKVTSFFRNPNIFEELRTTIIPQILENKAGKQSIRFWIAGCASGEEVYSIAICLHEILNESGKLNDHKIQIFASDLSEIAIEKARSAIYNASEIDTISEERLSKYFKKNNGDFKIVTEIREMCVFAVHNFLKDPPFANMDLISCRNVFIYMDSFLQKKALTTFHYSLRKNGYLLLGNSETSGMPMDLFSPISSKNRIFLRKPEQGRFIQSPSLTKKKKPVTDLNINEPVDVKQTDFRKSATNLLVSQHTPANVIVNEHFEIVHFNGNTKPFLEVPSGKPSFNLLQMARKGLAFELRNALAKVKKTQTAVAKSNIAILYNNEEFYVDIEVIPLKDTVDIFFLILFKKQVRSKSFLVNTFKGIRTLFNVPSTNKMQSHNSSIEKELAQVRDDMRAISEDQEAVNEELQSANEELLSSNEEMQSLNEELETSKEELQSSNEELIIINQEVLEKQVQLQDMVNYTNAIIATIREPFLVLDKDLRVKSANQSFYNYFLLEEQDVLKKHFYTINDGQLNDEYLINQLQYILPKKNTLIDFELTITLDKLGKRIMLLNAKEIENSKNDEKLILLALEDITDKRMTQKYKQTIKEIKQINEQLDQFVRVASHDLKEPLRKVLTFSNRLKDMDIENLSEEAITYIKKIDDSTNRMTLLINDLLNYSRITNHQDLFETLHLNDLLELVLADLEVLIETKDAKIEIKNLPELEAIPVQMNQLFFNLIGNALKFSKPDDSPKISIHSQIMHPSEVEAHSELNQKLIFTEIVIKDNGIGFDQKYADQIFTIFQRLHTKDQFDGTGIGLALCKKIVESHNGKLFVNAVKNVGSEFHILLPIRQP